MSAARERKMPPPSLSSEARLAAATSPGTHSASKRSAGGSPKWSMAHRVDMSIEVSYQEETGAPMGLR